VASAAMLLSLFTITAMSFAPQCAYHYRSVSESISRSAIMAADDPSFFMMDGASRIDWDALDAIVMASTAREDFGGFVGGSYGLVALAGIVSGATTAHYISSQLSQQIPYGEYRRPPAFIEWLAGTSLPSLEELQTACVPIARSEELNLYLCATPSGTCDEDGDLSDFYGQSVYVCY